MNPGIHSRRTFLAASGAATVATLAEIARGAHLSAHANAHASAPSKGAHELGVSPARSPDPACEFAPEAAREIAPEAAREIAPEAACEIANGSAPAFANGPALKLAPELSPESAPEAAPESSSGLKPESTPKLTNDSAIQPKAKIKKGIMLATVSMKGTLLEQFSAIRDAGFEGVEPLSHMDNDKVLEARDKSGLKIPSVCCNTHWESPLSDPDPKVRATGVAGLERALRDAKRYGASSVLFVPAVVTKQVSYVDAYTRSQAEVKKVIPLAEELGVKIAFENVWNQFLLSPLEAARYVDELQSKSVGWHFDVGNVINYGWPEQWIAILGARIQKLHIKEFSRKKRDDEGLWKGFAVEFLEGDDDWPAVMKALDAIGYDGWGIAEQGGANSPAGLANLSKRMDKIFAS